MAMKFLNKKGWHTGSLRNIEKVWIAEQKHEAEQKKVEEIRLQIKQEMERSELRDVMDQVGLVPMRPERVEFMYDAGYGAAVQNQDQRARADNAGVIRNNRNQKKSSVGALFDEKTHAANDSWRKSHSDPLLLIKQREEEARKFVTGKRKDKVGGTSEHKKRRA